MKRYRSYLMLLLLIWTCAGCAPGALSEGTVFSRDDIPMIHTMDELEKYVEEQLQHGAQEFTFSTRDLELEDIQNINSRLNGYYGDVTRCKSESNILSPTSNITLYCRVSDNYYVEQNHFKGTEIPEDDTEALELARRCRRILRKMHTEIGKDASDYEKELWIHDYLVSHTAYGYREGEGPDTGQSPAHESYGALVSHKAVCNGYAFAMKLLCNLSGLECRIITGKGNEENHAWNLVKVGDDWYHVDVTWDDPSPDQEGRVAYTYFNINDHRASLAHSWDTDDYPRADSLEDNYYIRNDLYCEDYDAFKEKCIRLLRERDRDRFQLMVGDYDGSIYSDRNMEFLFDYSDAVSFKYQSLGEIPYMTLFIYLNH